MNTDPAPQLQREAHKHRQRLDPEGQRRSEALPASRGPALVGPQTNVADGMGWVGYENMGILRFKRYSERYSISTLYHHLSTTQSGSIP